MSAFTDKVVENCLAEYERFEKGKGRENKDPFSGFVGEYWSIGVKNKNINGKTTFQDKKGEEFRPAWSSAFISYIMRQSGAGKEFFYHEGHIHYVVKAIRDAAATPVKAKFLGRDPATYAPKVGDIVNGGRGTGKSVTFATVQTKYGKKKAIGEGNFIPSHSDIVVEIDTAKRKLRTIGGNVETDTVGLKEWDLEADGTLKKKKSLICIIECTL